MILKGNKRGGATELALHLLNDLDNDHIEIHELRGFSADNLEDAFKEAEAVADEQRAELVQAIFQHHKLPSAGDLGDGVYYYTKKVKKMQPLPVDFVSDWIRIRADRDPLSLIELHLSLLREAYNEEKVRLHFRKFLAWYAAGYPGACQFRKFIFLYATLSPKVFHLTSYMSSFRMGLSEMRT